MFRQRKCMACRHEWDAPVELSATTANLSGEAKAFCPKCSSGAVESGPVMQSYAAEVVADGSGKFCGNALRFATREEAETYATDLFYRWTLCTDKRVVATTDPVNHAFGPGGLHCIEVAS